jgi:outer membrane protein assembly factor BamB
MRSQLHVARLLCVFFALATSALAERVEWSQWRGPGHDGIYPDEKDWSAAWGKDGPVLAWKVAVGTGYATVAVSEGRVYAVGHPEGAEDVVYCLDASTGKEVWTHRYKQELLPTYNAGGPNATPAVEGKWVYVFGKQGALTCFDKARGEVRWRRDLAKEDGVKMPMWGFASTPLIVGDRLFLNANESGVAVNKETGATIWKSKADFSGYASTVALRHGGEDCMAILGYRELFVVRQNDGKPVWRVAWPTKMGENSADPIAAGGMLYVSSWWEMGAALFDLGKPETKPVWTLKEFQNHIASPVLYEGHLYGFEGPVHRRTQKNALRCVEFKTGQVKWTQPDMIGSLLVADGKLVMLSNEGELIIAEVSPVQYKELSRAKLVGARSWAPPVLHRGMLYLRDGEHVYCFDLRKQ